MAQDGLTPQLAMQLVAAMRSSAAAALAGGIISAAGRPFSIGEAIEIHQSAYHALFPQHGHGNFEAWNRNRDAELAAVRK